MPIPLDVLLSIGVFASEADGKYGVTCMCVVLCSSLFPSASLSTPIREALYCPFYQSLESQPNPNLTTGTIARDRHAQLIALITMTIALSTMATNK